MSQTSNNSRVGFFLYSPNDKKVLLHKRDDETKTKSSPNHWDYFGGEIEVIDDLGRRENALIRELYEELGISVDKDNIKLLVDADNMYYIVFPKWKTPELRLGEGAGFAWFSFEGALDLKSSNEAPDCKNPITEGARNYVKILKDKID